MADYRCGLYQFLRIIFVTKYIKSVPTRKPHLITTATYHQSLKNLLIVASQPGSCKTLCKKTTGKGSN